MSAPTLRAWLGRWRRRCHVAGRCFEASQEGLALFPHLRPVLGATSYSPSSTVLRFVGGLHCWLVDEAGAVVDPTAHQYGPPEAGITYWPFLVQPADPWALRLDARYYCNGSLPDQPAAVAAWLERECGWSPPSARPGAP